MVPRRPYPPVYPWDPQSLVFNSIHAKSGPSRCYTIRSSNGYAGGSGASAKGSLAWYIVSYTSLFHSLYELTTLDGGGIRGKSSLMILEKIMEHIRDSKGLAEVPRPCDYFDLIGGTSTGGYSTSFSNPHSLLTIF